MREQHYGTIGILTMEVQRTGWANVSFGNVGGTNWDTANKAYCYPFHIETPAIFDGALWFNAGVAGSIDIGIYDLNGNRLGSTGNVTPTVVNGVQYAAFTADIVLKRGAYYMAMSASSTSEQVERLSATAILTRPFGFKEVASANPLPSTVTFADCTVAFQPLFAIRRK